MTLGFRVVLQQNERFSRIEEKYSLLHGKTSNLFDMEEQVLKVSKKVRLGQSGGAAWMDEALKGHFTKLIKKKQKNIINQPFRTATSYGLKEKFTQIQKRFVDCKTSPDIQSA